MGGIFSKTQKVISVDLPEQKYFYHEKNKKKSHLNEFPKVNEGGGGKEQEHIGYFFELIEKMERAQQLEHFQPPEFPIIPVIKADTHRLTTNSWKSIASQEHDDPTGLTLVKIKGSVYFYNRFFDLLFAKSTDFKEKFPTVQTQAHVMSNIIALCVAVKLEEIELIRKQLIDLGIKHRSIVFDPWQFSIFATTLHSTIKICLADNATPDVMSAWLNVLAFVLRAMMPSAITHVRPYAGAVNAASVIAESDQVVIKVQNKVKEMQASSGLSETKTPDMRKKLDNVEFFGNKQPRGADEASRAESTGFRQSSVANASQLTIAADVPGMVPGPVSPIRKVMNL